MRVALALALTAGMAASAPARADGGAVDWQKKVVRCKGSGAANLRDAAGNPAVARIGAERAAKVDALRNCMEALRGVQLQSGQSVGGALESDRALSGRVEALVRGFRVVGAPRYFSDGGVEMDVEVPLEGSLSDELIPKAEPKPPRAEGPAGGTSLVVDARGKNVTPALAPRVLDESGKEIYGPASLAAPGRKAGGTAAYAHDLEAAKLNLKDRVGDRPIVLKAVRAQGADLVISKADAAALAGKNLGFLADARVVILAD